MTAFAPILQAFFTDRLITQRQASGHTIAAYRDTFRLMLGFAVDQHGKPPQSLDLDDLDAPFIAAFLDHLETQRHNSIRTRNARLTAIHSLFGYAALRYPEHAALISRVLAIPVKRYDRNLLTLAHRTRNRGAAGRLRPQHLDRATRPHHAAAHRPNRAADLRADRPVLLGHPPRRRIARALPR